MGHEDKSQRGRGRKGSSPNPDMSGKMGGSYRGKAKKFGQPEPKPFPAQR